MMDFMFIPWPDGAWPSWASPSVDAHYELYSRPTPSGDDTLLATIYPGATSIEITGEANSTQYVWLRAVSRRGVADVDAIAPKLRKVSFDGDGNLILPAPNAPSDLRLIAAAGGDVIAEWAYRTRDQEVAPATYNIYVATGVGAFNFASPTHQVNAAGGRRARQSLGTFTHGQVVRCVVRCASAAGVEEVNLTIAQIAADADVPADPSGVIFSVEASS